MTALGIDSPVGPLVLHVREGHLAQVAWGAGPKATTDEALMRAASELARYFATGRLEITVPFLWPNGFAGRFAKALCAIPDGETRTYGDLAKALGVSAQAIGQACGANRLPIVVPCHRVLGADGLGGYSGAGGVEAKVTLLRLEGAGGLLI